MEGSSKTALLVIDVQQGLFDKSTPVYNAGPLLDNVIALVDKAHAAHAPVLYIQHDSEKTGLGEGSAGWQLHPRLRPLKSDCTMTKQKSNSFEDTDLDQVLKSKGVERLVITGLVTHGCVKNGCQGALEHGYKVTLAGDAHSSFSPKAAQLIEEWNQKLAAEGVAVQPSAEINFN